MSTFLQIFLLINVFIVGGLAMFAAQHAYAHFKPHPHEAEKPHAPAVSLPPETKQRLLEQAEKNFQAVLNHMADELQKDLGTTSGQLTKQLDKLGHEIVDREMQRYRSDLEVLRKETESMLAAAQSTVEAHQTDLKTKLEQQHSELKSKLAEEMAAEKARLVQQIDTKIADAVTSFLLETMQHNVDLGAQSAYLTTMLEEHKAELTKGIADEA